MNAGILYVLGALLPGYKGTYAARVPFIVRAVLIATAAGGVQLFILCAAKSYAMYCFVSIVVIIPGMVFALFGRAVLPLFLQRLMLSYLAAFLLGGIVNAAKSLLYAEEIPVWGMLFCVIAAKEGLRMFHKRIKRKETLCKVALTHRGKTVRCEALIDTGNHLRDEAANRPVHIISDELFKQLKITAADYVGLAGYCTLGTEEGVLPLYEIDAIVRDDAGEKKMHKGTDDGSGGSLPKEHAVVARAGKRLLSQKPYQVILHVEGVGED